MSDLLKTVKSTARILKVGINCKNTFVLFYGEEPENMKEDLE